MSKRVLIVIESLALGGAETVAVNLANGLIKHGCVVGVAAAYGPLKEILVPGIRFFNLRRFCAGNVIAILSGLNRAINEFAPQVIHCQNAAHCFLVKLLCFAKGKGRPKIVFTYHSKKTERIPDFISGKIFNIIADEIIVIAEHRKRSMLKLGVRPEKIHKIPNFVNINNWNTRRQSFNRKTFRESLGLETKDIVLIVSARLIPAKNVAGFVRILRDVYDLNRNVSGLVLGDGPELENLKSMASDLGIASRIHFMGFCKDVAPFYLASDLFVFPSRHEEVLPMSLIEAMAAGLPSICSNIEGNDEVIIDGVNGYLMDGREQEYAEKILLLTNDPALYARFVQNSLKSANDRFNEEMCIASTLGIYE